MKKKEDHHYTLLLTVHSRPGVLIRCIQIVGRRGHTIQSIHIDTASETAHSSMMTITASGEQSMKKQIITQLNKLVDVIAIEEKEAAI